MFGAICEIYAGDTSDVWEVGFEDATGALTALDANFSCQLTVADSAIDRAVTAQDDDGTRFRAWLTPEETATLGQGRWQVGIELRNPTLSPPLVREFQVLVRIARGVVPSA